MEVQHLEHLHELSTRLTGNKHVIPVACAVLDTGKEAVKVREVVEALGGRCPSNRVAEALHRLDSIGALGEMPWPGRPQPRMFEVRRGSPFWAFVEAWACAPIQSAGVP